MPGRVYEDDAIINVISYGVSDEETAESIKRQLEGYAQIHRMKGKPVLILTDVTGVSSSTVSGRNGALRIIKEVDFDKIAIFGKNVFLKVLSNFIIGASGKAGKVRYFDNKDSALSWLTGTTRTKAQDQAA